MRSLALNWFIVAVFGFIIAAIWVIPYRLSSGPNGYYTFGYFSDEYTYAHRIQTLIPDTTSTNPVNGICDPNVISPFFLEDACRAVITFLRMDVIYFFWIWRFAFPIILAGLLIFLTFQCLPRSHKLWSQSLRFAVAAAALALLYCVYDLVTPFPPLQGWLHRIPTNIEYLLAILMASLYVRMLRAPSVSRGAMLAIACAATVYLRFYTAVPWALLIGSSLIFFVVVRAVPVRVAVVTAVVLLLALLPWFIALYTNNGSAVYAQMFERYYGQFSWRVHPKWLLYCSFASAFIAVSRLVLRPWRELLVIAGLTLVALIFLTGWLPMAKELINLERYGWFYLVMLVWAMMLCVAQWSASWHGRSGLQLANRTVLMLGVVSLIGAGILAFKNCRADLFACKFSPYPSVVADLKYLKAYNWIAQNTPANALFLVDSGYDWSQVPQGNEQRAWQKFIMQDDLFLLARRRRIYHIRIYGNILSHVDYQALCELQYGTFGAPVGYPLDQRAYIAALIRFTPSYVLWRKTAPVPRNNGALLRDMAQVVYSDDICEIWKLRYSDEAMIRLLADVQSHSTFVPPRQ
ncbi:MAG: hypothetical protein V1899_05680 [Planctomycetota bacterium]